MKMLRLFLCIAGASACFCHGQDTGTSSVTKPGPANSDQSVYINLNRRVLEFETRFELLSQLAQEYKSRAEEIPRDQVAKREWESELAKELGDKASAIRALLTNAAKERLAFEQAHPDVAVSVPSGSVARTSNGPNADEISFLTKLEERVGAVQQELAATIEAGNLYSAQLVTNKDSYAFAQISYLLQENGRTVKQLRGELSDLQLRNLEFH